MKYQTEELNVLANRFIASCEYVDTCSEFVMDNYMEIDRYPEVKKNLNDISAQTNVMREIADETRKLAMNNPGNDLLLKESTSLMMSMVSTIGYINKKMRDLRETIKFTPNDISDRDANNTNMDWRKE
ncbi:MAG: hypothetical protein IKF29_00545 [Oceanobacillus sp.]|nr:hypothetical protein [Oceanobacillus sp.]